MGVNNQDELESMFGDVKRGLHYTEPTLDPEDGPDEDCPREPEPESESEK